MLPCCADSKLPGGSAAPKVTAMLGRTSLVTAEASKPTDAASCHNPADSPGRAGQPKRRQMWGAYSIKTVASVFACFCKQAVSSQPPSWQSAFTGAGCEWLALDVGVPYVLCLWSISALSPRESSPKAKSAAPHQTLVENASQDPGNVPTGPRIRAQHAAHALRLLAGCKHRAWTASGAGSPVVKGSCPSETLLPLSVRVLAPTCMNVCYSQSQHTCQPSLRVVRAAVPQRSSRFCSWSYRRACHRVLVHPRTTIQRTSATSELASLALCFDAGCQRAAGKPADQDMYHGSNLTTTGFFTESACALQTVIA